VSKVFQKSLLVWYRFWIFNQLASVSTAALISVSVRFARHANWSTLLVFGSMCLLSAFVRSQDCSSA